MAAAAFLQVLRLPCMRLLSFLASPGLLTDTAQHHHKDKCNRCLQPRDKGKAPCCSSSAHQQDWQHCCNASTGGKQGRARGCRAGAAAAGQRLLRGRHRDRGAAKSSHCCALLVGGLSCRHETHLLACMLQSIPSAYIHHHGCDTATLQAPAHHVRALCPHNHHATMQTAASTTTAAWQVDAQQRRHSSHKPDHAEH